MFLDVSWESPNKNRLINVARVRNQLVELVYCVVLDDPEPPRLATVYLHTTQGNFRVSFLPSEVSPARVKNLQRLISLKLVMLNALSIHIIAKSQASVEDAIPPKLALAILTYLPGKYADDAGEDLKEHYQKLHEKRGKKVADKWIKICAAKSLVSLAWRTFTTAEALRRMIGH